MAEVPGGGTGIHPESRPIWPTGKQAQSNPVNPSQTAQTPGGVRGTPGQTAPARPGEVTTPAGPQTGAPQAPTPRPSVARQITVDDIRSHLINTLKTTPNKFNTQLATLALQRGLELSPQNFSSLLNMIGSNKSQAMQEASILLLMKGIDSPQAAKVLGQFFAKNPGLSSQVMALQDGLGSLISALGQGQGLLDSSLIGQLTGILSQLDENFQKISQKLQGKEAINRNQTLNDVRALKALLQGVQNKAKGNVAESIKQFQGKLDSVMQNLLAQAVLSNKGRADVNYQYHQIPNAMTNPPKDFEIVVKRDGEGKESHVDPRNTQVVMSMETETLGKIVVSLIVKDKKVYVIFVFSEKDYAEKGRAAIAREFGDLQEKLSSQNFMVTGYQVKKDPAMCNIKTYLIPMLPKLEETLKRIDLEA